MELAGFGRFTHYTGDDGIRLRTPGVGGRIGYFLQSVRIGSQPLLLSAQFEGSFAGYRPREASFDTLRLEHYAWRARVQLSPARRNHNVTWFVAGAVTYERFPVVTGQQLYRSGRGFTPVLGLEVHLPRRTRAFIEGLTTFRASGSNGATVQGGLAWVPALRK